MDVKVKCLRNFCTLHPLTTLYATPPPSHAAFKKISQQQCWIKPTYIFKYHVHLPTIHIQYLTNRITQHSRLQNTMLCMSEVTSDATKIIKSYLQATSGAVEGTEAAILVHWHHVHPQCCQHRSTINSLILTELVRSTPLYGDPLHYPTVRAYPDNPPNGDSLKFFTLGVHFIHYFGSDSGATLWY